MLREMVEKYLIEPCDQSIVIQHAKVAQKSYGSEKRFFCPPPCIYLTGRGWRHESPPSQSSSSETEVTDLCAYMGINNSSQDMVQLHLEKNNFSSAKTLFISDSDKRKHFILRIVLCYSNPINNFNGNININANIDINTSSCLNAASYSNSQTNLSSDKRSGSISNNISNLSIGIFNSKPIKVISKPSKKKQSIKNPELCIASGSKIALFNRLRSQTVSTRYLHVEEGRFHASSVQWGSFYIDMIENDEKESDEFEIKEGYIHYGATVKLVCTVTGIALPRLIIRKVDKQAIMLKAEEPVSQLHKCAFQIKDMDRSYLCLMQDKILVIKSNECGKDDSRHSLNDGSSWSIISTESVTYTFCDAHATVLGSVTPVPIVHQMIKNGSGSTAMIELSGENFSPALKVWLGDIEAETFYRCEESMICTIPEYERYASDWRYQQLPVLLVRNDGVIYRTEKTFSYSQEHSLHIANPSLQMFNRNA